MAHSIEFDSVTKCYGHTVALDSVSFTVEGGHFFSILGPSGCGKTTLLRMVAGFEKPDSGRILLDGKDITNLPPHKRPVNTVFQNYALFPHLTIWENIAFGLRVSGKSETYIRSEVEKMLDFIQLESHANKYPDEMSGGQKQRVAIGRALINKPKVLLFDEPLAALDLKLRQKMLFELDLIHDEVGITFIFITHDQSEAMAVSDKIAVLNQGKLEQVGTPAQLYESPKSSFVAAFIGDTNFLDGIVSEKVQRDYSQLIIEDFPPALCFNDKQLRVGEMVHVSLRPEKIMISKDRPEAHPLRNSVQGKVEDVIYQGDHTRFWVRVGTQRIAVTQQHSRFLFDTKQITWHDEVWLSWHADDGFILERYNEKDETLVEAPLQEEFAEETKDSGPSGESS